MQAGSDKQAEGRIPLQVASIRLALRSREKLILDFAPVDVLHKSLLQVAEDHLDPPAFERFKEGSGDARGSLKPYNLQALGYATRLVPSSPASYELIINLWGESAARLAEVLAGSVLITHWTRFARNSPWQPSSLAVKASGWVQAPVSPCPSGPWQLGLDSPLVDEKLSLEASTWPQAPLAGLGHKQYLSHVMPSAAARSTLQHVLRLARYRLFRICELFTGAGQGALWLESLRGLAPVLDEPGSCHAVRVVQNKPKPGVMGRFQFDEPPSPDLWYLLSLSQLFSIGSSTALGMGTIRLAATVEPPEQAFFGQGS